MIISYEMCKNPYFLGDSGTGKDSVKMEGAYWFLTQYRISNCLFCIARFVSNICISAGSIAHAVHRRLTQISVFLQAGSHTLFTADSLKYLYFCRRDRTRCLSQVQSFFHSMGRIISTAPSRKFTVSFS